MDNEKLNNWLNTATSIFNNVAGVTSTIATSINSARQNNGVDMSVNTNKPISSNNILLLVGGAFVALILGVIILKK